MEAAAERVSEEKEMSIKPISLLVNDDQTVIDILDDLDNIHIALLTITENGVGHAYFEEDIEYIEPELLHKRVLSCLVVKKSHGYEVNLEV